MKNILADSTGSRIGRKRAIALLLSFLLFLSIMTIGIATAAADEESPAEEPPATEEPPAEEPPAEEPPAEEPPAEKPPAEEPAAENLPAEEIVKIEGQECVNMQVIVQFKNHVTKGLANNLLSSLNSEVESEITDDGMLLISVPAGEDIESFIAMLSENAYVAFVQPNYVYKLDQTVNDPYAATKQWHLDNINAYEAWDITMGSPSVRVAVLDTGIDLDHPEFSGQIYAQTDVVDDDGNAQDDNGHGTHVAGIIAAAANNEIGVAGVAPNVQLIIVDVSGPSYASTADIIEGLDYAAAHGADVVNISMGGYLNDTALEDEIADTVAGGIVVVAAAGNDATSDTHYPSDYASVIAVTATDMDDEIVPISNFGPQKDLAAPGILIYSTYTNAAGYTSMTGTSMASPMVAGVVALMLSANPDLGVSEVKDILYSTAADLGDPGRDDYYGNGRVDAYAAVAAAAAAYSTQYTVSVQANNAEYGAVSGGGDYAGGAEATVTAEPADGCSFSHWTDGSDTLSTSAQYTFTVTGDVTLTAVFEQSASPTITSSVYPIDRSSGLVKNITVETTIAAFKSKLDNAPESIHVYDKEGDECFEGIVSSGMTVALVVGDTVEDQLTISVLGDISGDGAIDITDILYIRAQITETYTLNACEYAAAEISQDACIDITDILYIRAHVIGNYFITGS